MWLINCRTLTLEEITNHREARYAILSHTWEKAEEVQYGEFCAQVAREKRGWQKIHKVCQLALDDGCDFAWVDTCCIDKTSSAELTEAINSMFPWYHGSEICYTYLADYDISDPNAELSKSRWFTRGWTLQELIAPAQIRFYDESWKSIGTKEDLSEQLSAITGIGPEVLVASTHRYLEETLAQVPIAKRMSWAAERETTRIEDMAYCLLGIFGINLPLLYGEGERSFMRLQEEIVKSSNDLSLLAWLSPQDETPTNLDRYCGVLAQRPREFQASDTIALVNDIKFIPDFTMTNKGLKIHTLLHYDRSEDLHVMEINCRHHTRPQGTLAIFLKHQGGTVFARARPHLFALKKNVGSTSPAIRYFTENRPFFLSKSITPNTNRSLHRVHRFSFVVPKYEDSFCSFVAAKPETLWDSANEMFITIGLQDFVGCHKYYHEIRMDTYYRRLTFYIVFGFGYASVAWVRVLYSSRELDDAIECENWEQVAHVATAHSSQSYMIHNASLGGGMYILDVKLEQGIKGGEPVYSVLIKRRYR